MIEQEEKTLKVKKRNRNDLSLIITYGSILLFFCVVLTIFWNYILIHNYSQIRQYAIKDSDIYFHWLTLTIGSFFFVIIIVGVVLFMVFYARQIILNQMQENFIDSVTHELKTPLTSIKLSIETLKKHELSKEQKNSFLSIMLKDVERLDTLVNHVLEATRLENIAKNYALKEFNLKDLIEESKDIVIRRYNLSNDNFKLDLKTELVKSDPTALQLVIINILDNAIKYSFDNIKIEIESFIEKNNRICIIIKDHGIGIPKSELNKVFRRFYRIPGKTENKKGSGLGLFIVKENTKNLRGKVEVFSEGLNMGTTFKITIPNTYLAKKL